MESLDVASPNVSHFLLDYNSRWNLARSASGSGGSRFGISACTAGWQRRQLACTSSLTPGTFPVCILSRFLRVDIVLSIKTWALKEAKARMEARGEATDYASYKAAKEGA